MITEENFNPEAWAAEQTQKWGKPTVARTAEELLAATGDPLNPRTLANIDCRGEGPRIRFRRNNRILYPAAEFFSWYAERLRPVSGQKKRN